MTDILNLNLKQREAAGHIDGPLLCLAGPGTGKTQIIAMRIANLLRETQMNPYNILCLTFTETGAVAMRKRLIEIIGSAAYYVKIFTFHGFCNDIIREWPEKFPFKKEAQPIDEVEKIKLLNSLIAGLDFKSPLKPFGDNYYYRSEIDKLISNLKKENIDAEKLLSEIEGKEKFIQSHGEEIQNFVEQHARTLKEENFLALAETIAMFKEFILNEDLSDSKTRTALKSSIKKYYENLQKDIPKLIDFQKIYKNYQLKLKEMSRYDFDDMIVETLNKLKSDSEMLSVYRERYQYILVDEYQDTNGSQNEIVELLGSYFESPNIFVVGDDKQSIYRFQGASMENILYFYKKYKNEIKIIELEENYRSTQNILNAADSLIQKSETKLSHFLPNTNSSLHSQKGDGEKVAYFEFSNPQTENFFICKKIQELLNTGTKASEIAVLYRENKDAIEIADYFVRMGLPFHLHSGANILEDEGIKKLLFILKCVENFNDDENLFRALEIDFLNFKLLDLAKLAIYRSRQRLKFFEIINNEEKLKEAEISEPPKFLDFGSKLLAWKSIDANKTFIQTFDAVINESGYLNSLTSSGEKIKNLNRLSTFFEKIKEINANHRNLNVKNFLDYLDVLIENKVQITEHTITAKNEAVNLMTVHRSKGLEFQHVFIYKCTDGKYGNKANRDKLQLFRPIVKEIENEEERRIFYVALTRAKKNVYLTFSKTDEKGREKVPSIFISEIDSSLIEKADVKVYEVEAENDIQKFFSNKDPLPTDGDLEAYLKSVLEDYKLNVSHLSNYLECPRKFYYRNLLRVPSAKDKHAAMGTAIHKVLEEYLKNPEYINPSERYRFHIEHELIGKDELADTLSLGTEIILDYLKNYSATFKMNSIAEYNFEGQNVLMEGVPITGKIDKIEILNGSEVNIVDYKTGNPDKKSKELQPGGTYYNQILFYKLLCDYSPQFRFKMQSGEIDFVQRSKQKGTFVKEKIDINPASLEEFKMLVKSVFEEIKNLEFLSFSQDRFCQECEYCEKEKL